MDFGCEQIPKVQKKWKVPQHHLASLLPLPWPQKTSSVASLLPTTCLACLAISAPCTGASAAAVTAVVLLLLRLDAIAAAANARS